MAIGQKGLYRSISVVVHRKPRISAHYKSFVSVKGISPFLLPVPKSENKNKKYGDLFLK
jgi:hypothetical protein